MSMLAAIAATCALFAVSFVPVLLADPKTPRGVRYSLRRGWYLLTGWMPGKRDQREDICLGSEERCEFAGLAMAYREDGTLDPERRPT